MALTLNTNIVPTWYTLSSDEDDAAPAKFKLKPLDGEQYIEVFAESEMSRNGDIKLNGLGLKLALRYGVVGWENIDDERGKAIKFSIHNIKKFPMEVLSELATEVVNRSTPDEDELKNS